MVYPAASAILPFRQLTTLSAIINASGPLTLITEIAPVPGTVAGAHIVSSFLMYISLQIIVAKLSQNIYLRKVLRVSMRVDTKRTNKGKRYV
jgi:hypothetical protein